MADQRKKLRVGGGDADSTEIIGPILHKHCVSSICSILDLPDSILREIFIRVPIKSVTRFTSVCSDWRRIVSEADFTDCYLKNSNFRPLLYYSSRFTESGSKLFLLEIAESGYDCIRTVVDPNEHDWLRNHSYFRIKGFCNGFICLVCGYYSNRCSDIYVINPVTGECIALPERRRGNSQLFQEYCLGVSSCGDKFKVLAIDVNGYVRGGSPVKEVEIVTVGDDDSWRTLSSDVFKGVSITYPNDIVYCNGAFHWVPRHGKKNLGFVAAFEFGDEILGQFPLPPGLEEGFPELGTLDDQLCVIDFRRESSIAMWVKKEHAYPDSWTSILISRSWIPPELQSYSLNPIARLPDGRILFAEWRNNHLMSFDIKENKFSRVGIYVPNSVPNDVKTCGLNIHPAEKV